MRRGSNGAAGEATGETEHRVAQRHSIPPDHSVYVARDIGGTLRVVLGSAIGVDDELGDGQRQVVFRELRPGAQVTRVMPLDEFHERYKPVSEVWLDDDA